MMLLARERLLKRAVQLDELTVSEQFAEKHKQIGKEFTLYFKRIRRKTGLKVRYLLVAEYHKSGEPHYHALIHERSLDQTITWRDLSFRKEHGVYVKEKPEWPLGYTSFRLVEDDDRVEYLCKYLSKSSIARVRASLHYGVDDHSHRLVRAIVKT